MSLGEFSRIDKFFRPLTTAMSGAFDLKDDAAEIAIPAGKNLVVTTDTIVENIHFIGDEKPASLAKKLLGVNLSDLAAKGAKPFFYSLSLGLPKRCDDLWVQNFTEGLQEIQSCYDFHLIGGDSIKTPDRIVLTASVTGLVDQQKGMIRRSTASVGDAIYVTGTIGDGLAGLYAARGEIESEYLLERYQHPQPRISFIPLLTEFATSAMDISDGLVADCEKLFTNCNLTAQLYFESVPISDEVKLLIDKGFMDRLEVVSGGDDYEILFTVSEKDEKELVKLAKKCDCIITKIGKVVPMQEPGEKHTVKLYNKYNEEIVANYKGFTHM